MKIFMYCALSLPSYVTDPNNLRLEFTVDHPELEQIHANQLAHAHEALQRWLAGDHTPNNDFRPH
jgi:glyoxylase I family protein